MDAKDLLKMGRISRSDYETYLIFEVYDAGRDYLKRLFESVCMEDPLGFECEAPFAHQDGRISVVRDFKRSIAEVKTKLNICEEYENGER